MTKPAHDKLTFIRIGGAWQPVVTGFHDFPALLNLDAVHWGMTSIAVEQLRTDKNFLRYLDSDGDGKIRVSEIRDALSFMISVFADGTGLDQRSDVLHLPHLNRDDAGGDRIFAAGKAILLSLGKPESSDISLAELLDDVASKSSASCNGDGVISASGVDDPGLASLIELIIRYTGGTSDLSGENGVDSAAIDRIEKLYEGWCSWAKQDTFKPEKVKMFQAAEKLADALDTYFLNSEAMAFLAADPDRLKPCTIAADVCSSDGVSEALTRLVIAAPDAAGELDTAARVNPLYREELTALFGMPAFQAYLKGGKLSAPAWRTLRTDMKKYADFMATCPETVFSEDDAARMAKSATAEQLKRLRKLVDADLEVGRARAAEDMLLKAVLYQRYLLEFLNNFINLSELFRTDGHCMLQSGTLVMDARRFSLVVPVRNPAEHRAIAASGNICVAYIEISRRQTVEKCQLAVAITSGSMRNLFVGKRGVFFSAEGEEYDARIVQFLDAPVSVSDALKEPFCKFAGFFGKQMDKLFSTRANDAQKALSNDLSGGKLPVAPANNSSLNGSMLLMGGGVGLAALGSSLAFIVKSLQNVSVWSVILVLLGILLVFGGPGVVVSLVRLYRRNLSRFFEASGCALNRNLRMSFALGRVFTCEPGRPAGSHLTVLPHLELAEAAARFRWIARLILVLLIAAAIWAGVWFVRRPAKAESAPAPVPEKTVEAPAPAPTPAPAVK
ncbi:MAG: hemophore-related protein [Lentisphaeria bacterium]|nr:hemophore-related protein [Lentisphaeria bacterium]